MYAEVVELEARWRTLSSDERSRAEVLLEDAAVLLDAECPPPVPLTDADAALRRIISCEMVKNAMANPSGIGVTSVQQGAGPYQQTTQYANPTGDLYITKSMRRRLGCGRQVAFTIPMSPVELP